MTRRTGPGSGRAAGLEGGRRVITSRDNPLLRDIHRLLRDGRRRRDGDVFALEGARLCEDAALSGVPIRAVLYTAGAKAAYPRQWERLRAACPRCEEIPEALAHRIGDTQHPQGLFCLCALPPVSLHLETLSPGGRYLALENLRDPGNLGTIFRTAEALGTDGLLLSDGCCDPYNPKVLRSSMGGVFRLPFARVPDMPAAVEALQSRGFCCFACVADQNAVPLPRIRFSPGSVCLVGNEGDGLTPQTVRACRKRLTIPMAGRAESLNAAMAAGIVLWELMKR